MSPYSLVRVDAEDSCVAFLGSEVVELQLLYSLRLGKRSWSLKVFCVIGCPFLALWPEKAGVLGAFFGIGISEALAPLVPSPE